MIIAFCFRFRFNIFKILKFMIISKKYSILQNHNILIMYTIMNGIHFLPIYVYINPQLMINYSQLYKSANYKLECKDGCFLKKKKKCKD